MNPKNNQSVLIVRDEALAKDAVKDWFTANGYNVITSKDGEQALKALKDQSFSVVVLDTQLKDQDSLQVLKQAKEKNPNARTIVVTGKPSIESIEQATRMGATDYLVKPFDPKVLAGILGGKEAAKEQKSAAEPQGKSITSMMDEKRVFPPSAEFSSKAAISGMASYKAIYNWSVADPDGFWAKMAEQLEWYKKWDKVVEYDFKDKPDVRFFPGAKMNITNNCLDRHLKTWRKNKAAIIWQGEPEDDVRVFTYQQLHNQVCKFANVLKKLGVKKGDTVSVYLPMIPELPIAMLACARIGAIHSVVFGGFSAESLRDRILDCGSKVLITADGYWRSGKTVKGKDGADTALQSCPDVKTAIIVKRLGIDINMQAGRDHWWHEEMAAPDISTTCEPEVMNADDPLFILYTSGSTGKPKGVLHTSGGYLMHVFQTMKWIFDVRDEDTFWCTADIGWITGHSYIAYGPLAAGATSVMFEGVPTYPKADRFWQIVEKLKVNIFYTAPTALRSLMREGDALPKSRDLSSLRLLGTVGEPINPEAWMWYHKVIGGEKCPIVDTWWQTETGGILITPLPGAIPTKPGSATMPFPGVQPVILREDGSEVGVNEGGYLCIKRPWPGIMRTVWGDPQRFKDTYFTRFPGLYFTGDGARRDEDGYFWLMGRIDDVIKVSGHRLGTAEIESALVSNPKVAEAAVVPIPHEIKGEGIYAYVTLKTGIERSEALEKELRDHVRKTIGPIATPDKIQFADALPKTRSGKIMRRILVKIAAGNIDQLGDTTTLADPSVVETLVKGRKA